MTYVVTVEGSSPLGRKVVLLDTDRLGWKADDLDKIERRTLEVQVYSFAELDLPGVIQIPDPFAAQRTAHGLRQRFVYAFPADIVADRMTPEGTRR